MAQNDNPHACRLNTALQHAAGDGAAGAFALEHPLSKSADIQRKFAWVQ